MNLSPPNPDSLQTSSSDSPLEASPEVHQSRRSRLSEPDLSIIKRSMSVRRKKTLLCTESSNFQVLSKFQLPPKKYGAACPTEYQKFMLKSLKISTFDSHEVRYAYPDAISVLSPAEPKVKRGRSLMCSIF